MEKDAIRTKIVRRHPFFIHLFFDAIEFFIDFKDFFF